MVTKRKQCNKGYGCGNTCISRTRTCKSNIDISGKKIVENFTQYVQRVQAEDKISKVVDAVQKSDQELERAIGRLDLKGLRKAAVKEGAINEALKKVRETRLEIPKPEEEEKQFRKELEEITKEIEKAGKEAVTGKEEKEEEYTKPSEPGKARRPETVRPRSTPPQPQEVINIGRRLAEKFINPEMGIMPDPGEFENLRNSLIETASFSAEEALENVEFSPTIEKDRLERIKKSLAESAMMTNQIPRKNFRMINDLRQPRAYADSTFSEADSWALLDLANEAGVAGKIHEVNNLSSQYYRENPTMYPMVNVGQYEFADSSTVFHEYAHHVEFANRDIATMNQEWVESRATGPLKSMNELAKTDVYDESEVGYPDNFISPYVAKKYPESGAGDQTEVLSIGFQYFSNPDAMLNLYNSDPEHFFLTLGTLAILRGEA